LTGSFFCFWEEEKEKREKRKREKRKRKRKRKRIESLLYSLVFKKMIIWSN